MERSPTPRSSQRSPLADLVFLGPRVLRDSSLLDAFDLESHAEPFEVLARCGGTRVTDHIEVFPEPERDTSTDIATCIFFVRGVQHLDGAAGAILSLAKGETLRFVPEPGNLFDPEAIVVTSADGFRLGYLPRYLTTYAAEALRSCDPSSVHLRVSKVGDPSIGFHTRLMVEFTCCWLDLDWPFAQDMFSPLHPVLV
jgi:HIRAN domain